MKLFITGATGLIGSHLLAHCVQRKLEVVALRRASSTMSQVNYVAGFYNLDISQYSTCISWVEADIHLVSQLSRAMAGCDCVIHCAADVALGGVDEEEMYKINVKATEVVLQAAKAAGVSRFCFLSSIAALGGGVDGEVINSPYSVTKRAAMNLVLAANDTNFSTVAICPGVVLGVSATSKSSSQILYLSKRGIPFSTKGGTGYVDVRDICKSLLLLVHKHDINSRYYILSSSNLSNHQLLTLLSKGFNKFAPIPLPKWLIFSAAYIAEFVCGCIGRKSQLNRSMARTLVGRKYYDGTLVLRELGFDYIPIDKTINDITNYMR